jgi:ribosomal protein S18 acetylase RimI-like enzyme
MEQPIAIQPLNVQHASAVSEIHLVSQQGTFLTSLGRDFLTALYSQISQSDYSVSYVALSDGEVVGFVVGTSHTKELFKEVALKGSLRLGWLIFRRALSRPVLLWHAVKTLAYPSQGAEDEAQAELLALAVAPAWRNKGIGDQLLRQLVYGMKMAEVDQIEVTVDGNNNGAVRFYRRQGFEPLFTFEMYGRPMVHLALVLHDRSDSSVN